KYGGDFEAAFEAYRTERVVRTARVQMSSRLMGDYIYHPDGAQRLVRNAVLRGKTPEDHYRSLEWLYGSTGLDGGN
ncbi:MAG: 3-hydroxybenzoate 6-monooxygenase, partial [Phycisphaerae bacterium]